MQQPRTTGISHFLYTANPKGARMTRKTGHEWLSTAQKWIGFRVCTPP